MRQRTAPSNCTHTLQRPCISIKTSTLNSTLWQWHTDERGVWTPHRTSRSQCHFYWESNVYIQGLLMSLQFRRWFQIYHFARLARKQDVLLRQFKTYSVADFANGLVQLRTSRHVNTLIIAWGNKIAQKSVPRSFVESYMMHWFIQFTV